MNKTTILLLCLVLLAFAHKDHQPRDQLRQNQNHEIYQPFTDYPRPEDAPKPQMIQDDEQVIIIEDRKQNYEEFNEMLYYGLLVGTVMLAAMLIKTCTVRVPVNRGPAMPLREQPMVRAPMMNKQITSEQIKNRIEFHKREIKRLEQSAKEVQNAQKMAALQRQRQQQTLRVYYNSYEMQQPRSPYTIPQYQYYQNIPVGRPVPKDNDSSFASEYPTI